ncbi:MAG: response regulator [Bacteroidota bacterium]
MKQLKENTFNDSLPGNHNIFLAHLSNLGNVKTFLSIVTTLQNEYPEMIILLYTGGTVAVDEKSKAILLDQTGYLFTPTYPDRVFFKGVGIYSNKDFCEALNLKSALERFLTTNDIKLFFQAIDRRLPLSDNTSGNIFLNNQDVVSKLKSIQGKKLLFIWDGNFAQEDDSPSKSFVTNLKDLNETVGATGQNLDFDAIIIIAELAWGRGQNEYEGLELAVKFRKENRYVGPLILISYSTIDDFERMYQHHKDAKFNIVFAPCTYLINISIDESPTSLKEEIADVLERATLLSAATLQDINTMLLNEEGDLIDRFTHALFIHKSDEELEWLFEYAKKITPEKSQHLNDLQKSIIIAKANKDEKGFESLRASLIQLLEGKFVNLPANHLAQRVNIEKNKPKILIIEDSIDYQQVLIQHLGSRFDLSIFSSGADAIEYLKQQDIMTEIGCIVSDWRLYRGESKYVWQEMQGYETIQQIALFHPASLVCLTSEIDKNVNIVRNFLGSNISFFKKQYLQSSTKYNEVWDVFADTIEDLCMNSMNLVSSQPTGSSWSSENAKTKTFLLKQNT